MPVNSLLERMRKVRQEKAAAAAASAKGLATDEESQSLSTSSPNGTKKVNGPPASVSALPTAPMHSSHRPADALPLPPPVFASPSSARLDYRDTVHDPLGVPFTSGMAVLMAENILRHASVTATAVTAAAAPAAPPVEPTSMEKKDTVEAAAAEASSTSSPSSALPRHASSVSRVREAVVVPEAVRHLTEVLDAVTQPVESHPSKPLIDTDAPHPEAVVSAAIVPSSTSPSPTSPTNLFEDHAYMRACALGHVDVSGSARPMCRNVNAYTSVGCISQGVYGVVFRAVATSDTTATTAPLAQPQATTAGHEGTTSSPASSSPPPPAGTTPRKYYALKHIKKMWLEDSQIGFPPYLLREIDLLLRLHHPNIMGARELVLLDPLPVPPPQNARKAVDHQPPTQATTAPSSSVSEPEKQQRQRRREHESSAEVSAPALAPEAPPPPQRHKTQDVTSASSPPSSSSTNATASASRPLAAVGAVSQTKDVFLVMDYCPCDLTTYMRRYHTVAVAAQRKHSDRDEDAHVGNQSLAIPFFHLTPRNAHPAAARQYLARAKSIAYQLFRAVAFLHANRVLHRDLKTSNVLLDDAGYVKVCDFGLGRLYREGQGLTPTVVTLMYRPPELHLGVVDYSHKMDIWSAGCILAELFLRRPLFHAATDAHHLLAVCDVIGIPTEDTFAGLYHLPQTKVMMQSLPRWNRLSRLAELFQANAQMIVNAHGDTVPVAPEAALLPPSGIALLTSIFQWNPRRRPSAEEVLQHPFFHEEPLPCAPSELLKPMPWQDAAASPSHPPRLAAPPVASTRLPPPPLVFVEGATGAIAAGNPSASRSAANTTATETATSSTVHVGQIAVHAASPSAENGPDVSTTGGQAAASSASSARKRATRAGEEVETAEVHHHTITATVDRAEVTRRTNNPFASPTADLHEMDGSNGTTTQPGLFVSPELRDKLEGRHVDEDGVRDQMTRYGAVGSALDREDAEAEQAVRLAQRTANEDVDDDVPHM